MIWEPFLLALVLGLVVSAGLYFAYLWPQIEPEAPEEHGAEPPRVTTTEPVPPPSSELAAPATTDDVASPAP